MIEYEKLREHVENVRGCPLYSKKSSETWLENHNIRAILMMGDLKRPIPKCTIAISTFKRPDLLSRAVISALDQEGFDDYEIVIGDNEGAPLGEKTRTQIVVEQLCDEKVFYYRYESSIKSAVANALADLVRTDYFLILHDDDVLNRYTLKLMVEAIKTNKSIDALCVKHKNLICDDQQAILDFITAKHERVLCRSIDFDETIFVHKNEFTGVLYRTQLYRELGGIHERPKLGCGDIVFASEFNYFYNRYYLEEMLYGATFHRGQLSAISDDWYPAFITKYYWYKAAMDVRKKDVFGLIKETLVRAYFFKTIRTSNDNYKYFYGTSWNVNQDIISDCVGIPKFEKKQVVKRNVYKLFIFLWERHIQRIQDKKIKEGYEIIWAESK